MSGLFICKSNSNGCNEIVSCFEHCIAISNEFIISSLFYQHIVWALIKASFEVGFTKQYEKQKDTIKAFL